MPLSPLGQVFLLLSHDLLTQEGGEHWAPNLQEMEKKEVLSSRQEGEDAMSLAKTMTTYISTRYYFLSTPHQAFSQNVMDPTMRYSSTDPNWKSE